ncbi:protein prenyltransferase alpha subunit repeat-containing protein 1 [Athalia rosae]|uniref:protein prenyltransferase alpha subunit repeat-containing protein 1 n=1 Tax=Athalia rosae TaxID=37344 RepID=UPI0020333176|nr:protein prenyltransferase alpha subunit repeat-containing protein 1 [Athalia rosae]
MQEDFFPAAEKILSDIENVLKKNPNLIGFEIIPTLDNENKSPVLHVENSLGLASWSVKPLYRYAYNRLLELRQNRNKREDPSTISRWLLGALLLNPDVTTFWNMRRELVKNGRLESTGELHFVAIVLYYKAKCFEAFAYRRWLLQFMLIGDSHTSNVETILEREMTIATISADRYANNYHAWNHREYIVTTFQNSSPENYVEFLKSEWLSSGEWCSLHISDYSGFAYRQFLIKKLLQINRNPEQPTRPETTCREILTNFLNLDIPSLMNAPSHEVLNYLHSTSGILPRHDVNYSAILAGLSYWVEECLFNEELLNLYPGHEAFWYHRRFLSHLLIVLTISYERYSVYKIELIDQKIPRLCSKDVIETRGVNFRSKYSPSHLETAYSRRNSDIIDKARKIGGHQNVMGERFAKFLSGRGLVV